MIIKVCDRCGKQYNPPLLFMQAKLPSYSITTVEGGFPLNWRQVDLCNECQDDFEKFMNELKTSNLEVLEIGDISNENTEL